MSQISRKKSSNLIEKPKDHKWSCSFSTENLVLPCIADGKTTRGQGGRPWESGRRTASRDLQPDSFWTNPGISLPKMRPAEKVHPRASTTERSSSSVSISSSASRPFHSEEPSHGSDTALARLVLENLRSEEVPVRIVGLSECPSTFEVDNSGMNNHIVQFDDPAPDESKALKNWEKWMKARQKQSDVFAEKLKRDKCRLVMNSADDVRQVNEEKEMLTYARIEPPDKWRGDPNFWKEPVKLARRGMQNEYCARATLAERGIVPVMEFVSVPDAVKAEKGIDCSHRGRRSRWERIEYLKAQRERYTQQLREMQPQKVDGRELMVVGRKIKPDEESECPVVYDVPAIEFTEAEAPSEEAVAGESVAALAVNGVLLTFAPGKGSTTDLGVDDNHTWSLVFDNSPPKEIRERILHVENRGTVAIRYEWVPSGPGPSPSGALATRTSTSGPRFFFDKNPGVFLPGQKTELKFYHRSRNPGYHAETWCLKLNPNLFGDGYGKIRLTAVTESGKTLEDYRRIDGYLDSCVRDTVVRETVREIFERAKPEVPRNLEYQSLFMEEELFEFQNPAHYYRYGAMEELKSLFSQVPLYPPQEWDLNLFTLEDLIRAYVTGKKQRTMLCRLMELTNSLLRPGPECCKFNDKHKMLYNALCGIIDWIDANATRIRSNFVEMEEALDRPNLEEKPPRAADSPSEGSRASLLSEAASVGPAEAAGFAVSCRDVVNYRFALYTMFFHCLCEGVEQAAGIVETCNLFEHHGEVVTPENTRFVEEEFWFRSDNTLNGEPQQHDCGR